MPLCGMGKWLSLPCTSHQPLRCRRELAMVAVPGCLGPCPSCVTLAVFPHLLKWVQHLPHRLWWDA